jgi:hypothetical protein
MNGDWNKFPRFMIDLDPFQDLNNRIDRAGVPHEVNENLIELAN